MFTLSFSHSQLKGELILKNRVYWEVNTKTNIYFVFHNVLETFSIYIYIYEQLWSLSCLTRDQIMLPAVQAQNPNHWTMTEVHFHIIKIILFKYIWFTMMCILSTFNVMKYLQESLYVNFFATSACRSSLLNSNSINIFPFSKFFYKLHLYSIPVSLLAFSLMCCTFIFVGQFFFFFFS